VRVVILKEFGVIADGGLDRGGLQDVYSTTGDPRKAAGGMELRPAESGGESKTRLALWGWADRGRGGRETSLTACESQGPTTLTSSA